MTVDSTVPGGGGSRSKSISETWVDPVIIGRTKLPAGKKWLISIARGCGWIWHRFRFHLAGPGGYCLSFF